jgi:hypothetical protein
MNKITLVVAVALIAVLAEGRASAAPPVTAAQAEKAARDFLRPLNFPASLTMKVHPFSGEYSTIDVAGACAEPAYWEVHVIAGGAKDAGPVGCDKNLGIVYVSSSGVACATAGLLCGD